jgi:hypothetical protein
VLVFSEARTAQNAAKPTLLSDSTFDVFRNVPAQPVAIHRRTHDESQRDTLSWTAQLLPREREHTMLKLFAQALMAHGKCDALYLDNGATYRGAVLPCAVTSRHHTVARQAVRRTCAWQDGALLAPDARGSRCHIWGKPLRSPTRSRSSTPCSCATTRAHRMQACSVAQPALQPGHRVATGRIAAGRAHTARSVVATPRCARRGRASQRGSRARQ